MPATATKNAPAYLREARLSAGYVNRGTAATRVPFSPETIGRHERGDVSMEPSDAVIYARCYDRPGLLRRYCAECPVGQQIGRKVNDRDLPFATLRVRRLIDDGQAVANRLEQIAFDGVIDPTERADFADALEFLRRLEDSITDIIMIGLENGTAAPGATEGGHAQK